jgi:hypothetical protein
VGQRCRRTAKLCVRISERQTGPFLENTESVVLVLIDLMPVAFGNAARLTLAIPGIVAYSLQLFDRHSEITLGGPWASLTGN